jgi:hypothetical protein
MPVIQYSANTLPTVGRFMRSNSFGRLIAGPVGSGKTTGCVVELLRRSILQTPGDDGLRHTRFAIVRQTLKQLRDTVLKDCHTWLGRIGEYKVSENTYYLNFDKVRSEWLFIPLEDAEDQSRLLSMQLTGGWMSECIEMDFGVIGPLSGRCGRYPSGVTGAPTWSGLIADTNMPTELTPWHKFMNAPPQDWEMFFQPSGLSPEAENLNYLNQTDDTKNLPLDHPDRIERGREYYRRLVRMYGEDSAYIKRYVKAQYGDDPSGTAVYRESFLSRFHVVPKTEVIPGYPLIVGQDFGRDPWSVICQCDHMGRLIVHEEVPAPEGGGGLEKHVQQNLRPALMKPEYLGMNVAVVGDPSGIAKNNLSEESNFDALKRMGFAAFPAPTNDIDPRLRAVESYLGRHTNGGPSIVFSGERCPKLIRGMSGGYRFTKMKSGERRAKPDKNEYSHVNDSLQYVCLVCHGGMVDEIARRLSSVRPFRKKNVSKAGWT